MPDEFFSDTATPTAPAPPAPAPAPRRGIGTMLLALVVAFLLGAAGVAYVAWKGLIPFSAPPITDRQAPSAPDTPGPVQPAPPLAAAASSLSSQQDQLEARIAALSARLDALTVQAQTAAGNATHAEALLVTIAVRRALDRGAPLNALEDQLRLRFGDSHPHAVATVIAAARQPVTLDQLVAGLDSLAPSLTQAPIEASAWARIREAMAGLFVIRREATPSPAPQTLLNHARILLESGRTEEAIADVRRLPGAGGATDWFTAARRYDDARRALDMLETAALIGNPVNKTDTERGGAERGGGGQPGPNATRPAA